MGWYLQLLSIPIGLISDCYRHYANITDFDIDLDVMSEDFPVEYPDDKFSHFPDTKVAY